MSIKKLDYYLQDADITLRSDHLPLKKFLEKKTLNSKVNNWAVEISQYKIKFEYIKGIKNALADTMSCLIKITPKTKPPPEPEGYEFGYYAFEELDPIKTEKDEGDICDIQQQDDQPSPVDTKVDWRLSAKDIRKAQSADKFCTNMLNNLIQGKPMIDQTYHVEDGIPRKYVTDNKQRFDAIVVPAHYTLALLRLAHDELGHNGSARTYMLLRRLYYWNGIKPHIYHNVDHVSKETDRLLNMSKDNLKLQLLQWNLFIWI